MTEIDNLKKFGQEFQTKCVSALISDKLFLERIYDILSVEYWETDANKWVVETTKEYFIHYKDLPTLNVFKIKSDNIENEVLKRSVIDQLRLVYTKMNDTDLKFVKEQFLEFCRNQKLKNAIMESVDYLKQGQYDSIKNVVDDALKAGSERNLGHDYTEDIEKRMSEMARETIPTGWEIIDQICDGGLAKGELGFIVAPAGSGKSWLLARLGAEAMKRGKNVAHFTLELNENYVGLRYDACFTGIDFQSIRQNVEIVKKKISDIPGRLFIKYFPIKTIAPHNLKTHAERIQMLTGKKIDMMVVDYADLLRPMTAEKNSNSYSEAGSVYEELRTVAGELQIPIWTASQSNRSSHEEEVIQAHNVADSYRKIMTGDFILSLSRKMEDKAASTARIHVMKNRFGADGITFPTFFDSSNGNIQVFDPSTREGIEVQQKMSSAEDTVKNILRDNWNKVKKNKALDEREIPDDKDFN
jgi:RecA/RadA recombinase